ncbi:MAG TPA: DUF1616 domain-containing protein [Phototrophicaceae bacterium]|nr:DUF1616 domain-containing protein [Phototrophicaceae bacterium]
MSLRKPLIESALLTITVVAVALVLETMGVARAAAALLLVFVLPGRAFLAAWFPYRLDEAPGNLLLTFFLSIAIAVIGGLVLNLLPQGLEAQTWAVWLGAATIFNGLIALLRSVRPFPAGAARPHFTPLLPASQALMIGIAVLLVAGSLVVARSGALNQPYPGFTQLWMLPADTPNSVQIGVLNEEGQTVSYWLVVRQGTTPIQAHYDIQIDAGGTWNGIVSLPPTISNTQEPIEAQLYRADSPNSVYRDVSLSVSEMGSK